MSSEKKSITSPISSLNITISTSLEDIPTIFQPLKIFAQNNGIPLQTVNKIQQVLTELLNSIIEFNDSNHPSELIFVDFNLFQLGKLTINIRYQGLPFNPFCIQSTKENQEGGLGWHLTKRVMDEYTYLRTQQTNLVYMCKTQV